MGKASSAATGLLRPLPTNLLVKIWVDLYWQIWPGKGEWIWHVPELPILLPFGPGLVAILPCPVIPLHTFPLLLHCLATWAIPTLVLHVLPLTPMGWYRPSCQYHNLLRPFCDRLCWQSMHSASTIEHWIVLLVSFVKTALVLALRPIHIPYAVPSRFYFFPISLGVTSWFSLHVKIASL